MSSISDSFPVNIDYTNLRQLDLNLLVALDVLITEASVTKAAERLDLSQSAMSYSLKRLRTISRCKLSVDERGELSSRKAYANN